LDYSWGVQKVRRQSDKVGWDPSLSQLTLVQTAAGYAVQTLNAGQAGLPLSYRGPKNQREPAATEAKLHSQLTVGVSTLERKSV